MLIARVAEPFVPAERPLQELQRPFPQKNGGCKSHKHLSSRELAMIGFVGSGVPWYLECDTQFGSKSPSNSLPKVRPARLLPYFRAGDYKIDNNWGKSRLRSAGLYPASYMKAFATRFGVLAVAILAASVLSLQAQPKAVSAKVRAVRGSAKYSDNGSWHTLKVNDVLKTGSVIQTEKDSTVDLFINNSVIRITPDTTFGLTKALATETEAETITDTELYLKSGRILGNVKKLAAASKYQIKTPNGVTGIRGTELDISYLPGPTGYKLVVRSVNGTLLGSAANKQGQIQTAVINTGESWSPDDGITLTPQEVRLPIPPFDEDGTFTPPVPQPGPVIRVEPNLGEGASPSRPNR